MNNLKVYMLKFEQYLLAVVLVLLSSSMAAVVSEAVLIEGPDILNSNSVASGAPKTPLTKETPPINNSNNSSSSNNGMLSAGQEKSSTDPHGGRFLNVGWHPYLGINYVRNSSTMMVQHIDNYYSPSSNNNQFDDKYSGENRGYVHNGSIFLGLGYMFTNNIFLAAEGEFYFQRKIIMNTDTNQGEEDRLLGNVGSGRIGDFTGFYSVKPLYNLGVRLGWAMNSTLMPYVKGGIAGYDIISSPYQQIIDGQLPVFGLGTALSDNLYNSQDMARNLRFSGIRMGFYIGVGIEVKLAKHIFLRGEYEYSQVESAHRDYYRRSYVARDNFSFFGIHNAKLGLTFIL